MTSKSIMNFYGCGISISDCKYNDNLLLNISQHSQLISILSFSVFLFASSFNILRDANTLEIAYRDSFVNPIIPKAFDDMNDRIRFQMYVMILCVVSFIPNIINSLLIKYNNICIAEK